MVEPCLKCQFYRKVDENTGLCMKYGFMVWVSLARRDRACRGFDEEAP